MRSFDSVSIDSDLDSVRTEQVRRHIHRRSGERLTKVYDNLKNIKKKSEKQKYWISILLMVQINIR